MANPVYYIREAQGQWAACNAKTMPAAKRAAVRAQMFQGTDVWVGSVVGEVIEPVAIKRHPDALNMSSRGRWVELDPAHCSVGDFGRI
ncbi:hypothetical protein ACFOHQ_22230 [Xanthomonas fragariae]|nr:hypothetical protein BER92_19455 [Xanthomonas fragariae]